MKKKCGWFIVCFALAMSCAAGAQDIAVCTPAPPVAILKVQDLPPDVQKLLSHKGHIADPGKEFNATDVIYDATVPQQRLVSAVSADDCILATVERGGRGHLVSTLTFQRVGDHWSLVSQKARPPATINRESETVIPSSPALR